VYNWLILVFGEPPGKFLDLIYFCPPDPRLLGVVQEPLPEESKASTAIHDSFTEVSLFRSLVLDERSSDAPFIRLSWTDVVANG